MIPCPLTNILSYILFAVVRVDKFRTRLEYMAKQPPTEFSFWVAKQMKNVVIKDIDKGLSVCQKMLEMQCPLERLQLQAKLISELLGKLYVHNLRFVWQSFHDDLQP